MSFFNLTLAGFSLYQIFWYFAIYALLGWCLEVCFDTVRTGKFVNRGFLNGPVCPIYGFGMVIVILVLTPIADNFILLYFGTVILASALEFVTGWVLKKIFHTTWWDYSDVPFNLGGYVCLKFSLLWGVGGVFVMDIIQPVIAGLVGSVPVLLGQILALVVFAVFIADTSVTVVAMAKLNKELGALTKFGETLRKGSDVMAKSLGDAALTADSKIDAAKDVASDKLEAASAQLAAAKDVAADKLDAATDKLEAAKDTAADKLDAAMDEARRRIADARAEWAKGSHFVRRRLVRAFPNAKHSDYDEALTRVKNALKNLKDKKDDTNDENNAA